MSINSQLSLKQLVIAVTVYLSFHKLMKFQLIENKKAHVIMIIKGVFNEIMQMNKQSISNFLVPSTCALIG